MKKEIWVCLVHTLAQPSVVSSDGYSSLSAAQDALMMRLGGPWRWESNFVYVDAASLKKYELKCITIED